MGLELSGMEKTNKNPAIVLPLGVVGKVDLGRLIRELEALDNFVGAAEVRQPGTQPQLPKTSRLMDELIESNKLNVLVDADREQLKQFLQSVRKDAPVLHMSFSADPSPLFTKQLITWLRKNLHPLVLLQVGLQPTIGAGAVVRTTNKYFDLSLRDRFDKSRDILLQKMRGIAEQSNTPADKTEPAPDTVAAVAT